MKSQNASGTKTTITGSAMSVMKSPAPVGLPADFMPPKSLHITLPRSRGSLFHSLGSSRSVNSAAVAVPPARSNACEERSLNGPQYGVRNLERR